MWLLRNFDEPDYFFMLYEKPSMNKDGEYLIADSNIVENIHKNAIPESYHDLNIPFEIEILKKIDYSKLSRKEYINVFGPELRLILLFIFFFVFMFIRGLYLHFN